jgi:hypothetical protein
VHGVGDEHGFVPTLISIARRDIAGVIGRHLNLPVTAVSREDADGHFGWFGRFAQIDNPSSSTLTQNQLAWHPEQVALIPDLDEGHYFNVA